MKTNRVLKIQFEDEEIEVFKDICKIVDGFLFPGCGSTSLNSEESTEIEYRRHSQKIRDLFDKIKMSVNSND